jgi:hypothetical protein
MEGETSGTNMEHLGLIATASQSYCVLLKMIMQLEK